MATKKNYIDSGVSDSDLISLAGNLQASQLAVPEKTTWDFIQEDIEEWQGKVQARAAKFMQDLPEDFDLNKVEPEGREAIGKWYKSMRKDFMKAANKASLFDPGSFAYGEGTNSMNKIEDNLGSINGIFENIKTVRTKAIKDKDKLASQVTGDNKALLNAIISGEMFENMEIKDGDITFKVDGYMEKDKESENFGQPKIFTSEDIQNGALKLYDSESSYNAIVSQFEAFKVDGIAWEGKTEAGRTAIQKALNDGKKTGENLDLMFDINGGNENEPISYAEKWLKDNKDNVNTNPNGWTTAKDIKENIKDFYNDNEGDFVNNFLLPQLKSVYDRTKVGDKAADALEKGRLANEETRLNIDKKRSELVVSKQENTDLSVSAAFANEKLLEGGSTFNYNGFRVSAGKLGGFNVKKGKEVNFFADEVNMRGHIVLPDTEEGKAARALVADQKRADNTTATNILKDMSKKYKLNVDGKNTTTVGQDLADAFSAGPSQTIAFLKQNFGSDMGLEVSDGDTIKITIDGISNEFMTSPAFYKNNKKKAMEMMQFISDNLSK